MSQTECDKCDYEYEPVNNWHGLQWLSGEMRELYTWKNTTFKSPNQWTHVMDEWQLKQYLGQTLQAMAVSVDAQFVSCMVEGQLISVEKIACLCGIEAATCNVTEVMAQVHTLVSTEAFEKVKESVGNIYSTHLAVEDDSVNNTVAVAIQAQPYIPPLPSPTRRRMNSGGTKQLRRATEDESSLNNADCYTAVENSNGFLVGQIVSDECATLQLGQPLAEPTKLCVATSDVIARNPAFTVAGIGLENDAEDSTYRILDVGEVTVEGGQHCFFVSDSITACPIIHIPDPEAATENAGEESCRFLEELIELVELISDCNAGDQAACDLVSGTNDGETGEDDGGGGLSLGAWIGIGIGGAVLGIAVVMLFAFRGRTTNTRHSPGKTRTRRAGRGDVTYSFDDDETVQSED